MLVFIQTDKDSLQPLRIGGVVARMSVEASEGGVEVGPGGESIVRGQNFLVAPRYISQLISATLYILIFTTQ